MIRFHVVIAVVFAYGFCCAVTCCGEPLKIQIWYLTLQPPLGPIVRFVVKSALKFLNFLSIARSSFEARQDLLVFLFQHIMVEDKYIGLALAVSSSLAIGTSFIITKKVVLPRA